MATLRILIKTLGILGIASLAHGQVAEKKALTLDGAKKAIAATEAEVKRLGAPGCAIAVVDDGGNLLALERLDGTFAASANISIGKARTAALFQKPTKMLEEIVHRGRTTMVTLPDFTPLRGGVPIVVDNQVVGAIGVSGAASPQQDEELAIAGAKALESTSAGSTAAQPAGTRANGAPAQTAAASSITYFPSDKVAAAFAKGMPLLEAEGYKIHASRREKPGMAELHERETDVMYVLEGSATFVTGGKLVDPKITEPGQILGRSIEGGESRRVGKGDVIVVPDGVPHWFKEVNGPLLYFVVKPISHGGRDK